ncbi:MAG: type III ribulose-bisphosphate carboxylase [Nanoarchaeota archaeon]|nr:type III ribulose-bisphosphate carboxylase [Nanoarchaeota archaeon]
MTHYLDFVDLKYRPKKSDLVCEYYVEPNKISLEKVCEMIAGESSIGSWDKVLTLTPKIAMRLKPHVFSINKKTNEVKIAYTSDLFEGGNMPGILSSIAGNIFGMKDVKNLRLQDITFPEFIVKSFKGPYYGIEGVRRILKIKKRPLVGTIVKPKVGLNSKEHAKVAYEAWVGGCDLVKDDENLVSMSFNKFEDRVVKTLELKDKAERETGEKKLYVCNVTAETNEMLRRAQYIKDHGGKCAMIDIITCGWSALQTLRNANLKLILHAHRSGHGMFTENPKHGMSMLVVAKVSRLIGVDQIHVGAILGKMKGGASEVKHIGEEIEERIVDENKNAHVLSQKWYGIKPIFSICSGGLHPSLIPSLIKIMGKDIICQAGAGVHAHPGGTRAGATAMRQALESAMKKIPLNEYAKTHEELKVALDKWGYTHPK